MLDFTRDSNTLRVTLHYFIPYGGDWSTTFTNSVADDHHAQLSYMHMRKAIEKRAEEIRREAYEQGWKDRGAKRAKQKYFSSQF